MACRVQSLRTRWRLRGLPAGGCVARMADEERPGAERFLPEQRDLQSLRAAAPDCRGCELYRDATQVVFSTGHARTALHRATTEAHAEALAGLSLGDPVLERIRDTLIDAAFTGRALEGGEARSILAEAGLGPAADELCRTNGLAFSFLRGDADPSRAVRDLGEAIDVLVTRPVIEQALAEATRAFGDTTDEGSFAEQQRLTREKYDVERRLMDLMQPDGD